MNTDRIARVAAHMKALNLPQILVSSVESIYYLTGIHCPPGERLQALILNDSGDATFITNQLFALRGAVKDATFVEYTDTQDSVSILSSHLQSGSLGIDKSWASHFLIRLMALRPDIRPALGSAPVDLARMLKDDSERAAMIESSRLNDEIVGQLRETLREGETERDVARRYIEIALSLGADGASFNPLICFGKNAAEPHHEPDDTRLRLGDAVIMDVGCAKDHAMSDMTRTVFFGEPTQKQREVYDIVLRANRAAKAAVRPGAKLSDIDRAARSVIEQAGYSDYFIHRTGHGIGIEVHEPPDVSATSEAVATPGMVFSIEPGIYLPGEFGVRIEDLVLVTDTGCTVLNALDA